MKTLAKMFTLACWCMCFSVFAFADDQQVELKKTPNIKVDINDLLSRVRDEKKKERKENLLFLGLIGSVIVITGIIASL